MGRVSPLPEPDRAWTGAGRQRSLREVPVSAIHHHKYTRLSRGPYFEPVVATARAYLTAAVPGAPASAGVYWALSCLPATTRWRLSAVTMRITDMLVITRPRPGETGVQALAIVQRSALQEGFGYRRAARDPLPGLDITDSDYHGAGPDQALIRGPWQDLVAALTNPLVAEAARLLAEQVMATGRTLHWRGHNHLLTNDVLDDRQPE